MVTARTLPDAMVNLRPDAWTQPFWDAARDHRLVAPRCTSCGTYRLPPHPFCPNCRAQEVEWDELSGQGELFSFTTVHHAVVPQLAEHTPYVVAVVGLPDAPGCRLVGNLVDVDTDEVRIGTPLQVVWHDAGDWTVPRWRPA